MQKITVNCDPCKGKGGEYVPYVDIMGEFVTDWEMCGYCGGTGEITLPLADESEENDNE